jgi:glycosyltransferase involved in cell wall biosynthesis
MPCLKIWKTNQMDRKYQQTDESYLNNYKIAVLIPCYNEEKTIAKVIRDFKQYLPYADIYVFDNNSKDASIQLSIEAGAEIFREKNQGKGFVISSMLKYIDADLFVMVDADDTYPADCVNNLILPILNNEADMVVGQRLSVYEDQAFRPMHVFGNQMVCALINRVFQTNLVDPMSGYRAFTREVALNLPVVASGFDVETEMTLQLLYRKYIIHEVTIPYRARPEGSTSKLRTYRDGFIILGKILGIVRSYKPLTFFGSLSIAAFLISLIIGAFPVYEYLAYRYVFSVPKAILAAAGLATSITLASVGLILNSLNFRILEMTHVLSKQIMFAARKDRGDTFDCFHNRVTNLNKETEQEKILENK